MDHNGEHSWKSWFLTTPQDLGLKILQTRGSGITNKPILGASGTAETAFFRWVGAIAKRTHRFRCQKRGEQNLKILG